MATTTINNLKIIQKCLLINENICSLAMSPKFSDHYMGIPKKIISKAMEVM